MKIPKRILLIAATHGVEPQSAYYAQRLVEQLELDPETSNFANNLQIIPVLNPHGLKTFSRTNARGVDLNRNLPSSNWQPSPALLEDSSPNPYYGGPQPASEKETQDLVETIRSFKPDLIISLHTNHYVQNPNPPQVNLDLANDNPEARQIAQHLAEILGLILSEDIGYPTPGSLGSYAKDLSIPCITIEFDDELDAETLWQSSGPAFLVYLKRLLFFQTIDVQERNKL